MKGGWRRKKPHAKDGKEGGGSVEGGKEKVEMAKGGGRKEKVRC